MTSFNLSSENQDFKDRQKRIFDQLQVLENNRNNVTSTTDSNEIRDMPRTKQQKEMRHFRGKESIFKKPLKAAPKNYMHRMPDFKKNPHKWTKYSLEDVQEVTEESNKKSAMDFLKELANRRKAEQGITTDETMEEVPTKIVFNKHAKKSQKGSQVTTSTDDSMERDAKAGFSNSKLVMPEYNFGDKPSRKVKNLKLPKPEKCKELKLDHLAFEDE